MSCTVSPPKHYSVPSRAFICMLRSHLKPHYCVPRRHLAVDAVKDSQQLKCVWLRLPLFRLPWPNNGCPPPLQKSKGWLQSVMHQHNESRPIHACPCRPPVHARSCRHGAP